MSQRLKQRPAVHHDDSVEVVNEVDEVVYLFTGSAGVTAEYLVDNWASTGTETWTAQRAATAEDLVVDPGPEELARMLVGG